MLSRDFAEFKIMTNEQNRTEPKRSEQKKSKKKKKNKRENDEEKQSPFVGHEVTGDGINA